jgi:hypothetical protein
MSGIDRERREHRQQHAAHVRLEKRALLRGHAGLGYEGDVFRRQQRQALAQKTTMLCFGEFVRAFRDRGQTARRVQPVRSSAGVARRQLPTHARHAHHEKLVEIRTHDRQELEPLEQRHARVLGLFEHTLIELEPRQLVIHVQRFVHVLRVTSGAPLAPRHFRKRRASRHNTPSRTLAVHTVNSRYPASCINSSSTTASATTMSARHGRSPRSVLR